MPTLIRPYDLLLEAGAGWRPLTMEGVSIEGGSIELRPRERLRPDFLEPHGSFGGHTLPRGIAIRDDEIFIADPPRHRILHWRPCCGLPGALPTIGGRGRDARQLDTPQGLAISHRGDLVVVDSGNRRLLLFTLPGLALRRVIGPFPSGRSGGVDTGVEGEGERRFWQPVDAAAGPEGALYVADAQGLVWRLDTQGRPDHDYSGRLPDGLEPTRIQVDDQGRAYVLSLDWSGVAGPAGSRVLLILNRFGSLMPLLEELAEAVSVWLRTHLPELVAPDPRAPAYEEEAQARAALLPPELSRRMDVELRQFIVRQMSRRPDVEEGAGEDALWDELRDVAYNTVLPQAYAALLPGFLRDVLPPSRLIFHPEGVLLAPSAPGACDLAPQRTDLVIDQAGRLRIDRGISDAPYVLHHPPAATYETNGLYRTEPLDSGLLGNPWHRVALDLEAAERTAVRLFSFTSDVLRPDLTATGGDPVDLLAEPPRLGDWEAAPDNADEWLVQSPPGRYLYLALVLKGPGNRTPRVGRIYIYQRRQSSLQYLPALYQADETSRRLLDRLLSLFDTIFGEIETQIEDFPLNMDVSGAPPDFLPWLASWFDLSLEQSWSEQQRRDILRKVVKLYRWRGTVYGLRLLLQLHAGLSDPMPQVIEHYRGEATSVDGSEGRLVTGALRRWLGQPPQGDPLHHFSVFMPGHTLDTPDKREVVERLINASKPAHTHFTLRPVYPCLRLGSGQTRGTALGVDSLVSSHTSWRLPAGSEEDGILGARTILPSPPAPRSVGVHLGRGRLGSARLGSRTCRPCVAP